MRHQHRSIVAASVVALIGLSSVLGIPIAAADDPDYYLPAPMGTALIVSQGNAGASERLDGRTAAERYAFDFIARDDPERFPVLAARGGTVIGQRAGVKGGRCTEPLSARRPSCWRDVNYVLIDHGDGTSGLYLHLKKAKPRVRIGQVISAGERIGTAGTSGWTDQVGVQFQVQSTPVWNEVGSGGWFQTATMPVSFADEDVSTQRSDGVPQTDDLVVSGNPGPSFDPFRFQRRPVGLPASVPFELGSEREISSAYDADAPDGYGLSFAPEVEQPMTDPGEPLSDTESASVEPTIGTEVRPLFGGELAFAGCGSGASAALGRMVAIEFSTSGVPYLGILGHLSDIDPSLLALDPEAPRPIVGPNDVLGHYGAILPDGVSPVLDCPAADPTVADLFVSIIRDAVVTPEGEIGGGTPVSPEPLIGERGYEGLTWWHGPLAAVAIADEPGQPRARWNRKSTASASHVPFGESVRLTARVVDRVDIAEVRFRAFYPRWPRPVPSAELVSFSPATTWRELAVCTPPGISARSDCTWNGSAQDALVTFRWDPNQTETSDMEAWLPRARTTMTRSMDSCVPVSLAVEVVDTAGKVYSEVSDLPRPRRCDQRSAERAANSRLVYLDPLVPPRTPVSRTPTKADRPFPRNEAVFGPDRWDGDVAWRDRSDNEDGYRVYARRQWLLPDCSLRRGDYVLVDTLTPNTSRYSPRHQRNLRLAPAPNVKDVPGELTRYDMYVSAFNEAGETPRVKVGGFIAGGEAFCDLGVGPPPELEP